MNHGVVPAVVLAAGFSRRLGYPKALVKVNGQTLVEWAHQRLLAVGCQPVVVVNASIEAEVRARLPAAHLVVNPNPDLGRTGSLQLGLNALSGVVDPAPSRTVMVPVDRPCWNVALLDALLEHEGSVAPSHDGRKGHPVVMDAEAMAAVKASRPDVSLRELVKFTGVAVEAPWLHMNIDTANDVERLNAEGPHQRACFEESEGI